MTSFLAYLVWDLDPILAHLGPLTLRWYGLLFMAGFVVSTPVFQHIFRSENVSPRWVDVLTIYMLVGTVVGARLGHIFFYEPDILLKDPLEVVKIWHGGLASHGATLSIPLACWLFARHHQFDPLWVLDRIVIVVGIGGALIRLGNFMNSEIGGYPTTAPWAVVFPRDTEHLLPATRPLPAGAVQVARPVRLPTGEVSHQVLPADAPILLGSLMAVPRHPTQLYEALYCVLLVSLLYYLWNRTKERTPRGLLLGLFLVLLFTQRLLGEFLKEAQVAFEKDNLLNQGQLLSLPPILVGLWLLWRAGKWKNNPYGYAPRDLDEPLPTERVAASLPAASNE
ncbi:prolipoprotein diacylglyceryl transferase [Hymenobacter crusticola]|uniref:Phosphatidylglycerol--prolipoprotein diacylglyceryl transferase n=1 Tax=Hymenobacter crusticola TaxID=1770526 RepID=A0A243W6Q8_9BACT|nr:prolipoprotein diacylglyceryl transferase [Hymenobacter crusticola]OUJ70277.1 prolipoprotein diacylglyceryl transferase [Hymenobacter crusticola]